MKIGRSVLLGLVAIIALVMAANAALWLLVPARAAEALAMPLLTGAALSSQMDIAAFFLAAATFTVLGLITRNPPWFVAAAVLLGGAAAFRTVAFLFHGATFAADMVGIEIVMSSILVIAARVLVRRSDIRR